MTPKVLGRLPCRKANVVHLLAAAQAFSGQMNGEWECPGGWVEPIGAEAALDRSVRQSCSRPLTTEPAAPPHRLPPGRMMKDNPIYRIAQRRIEQLGREAAEASAEYAEASRALKVRGCELWPFSIFSI